MSKRQRASSSDLFWNRYVLPSRFFPLHPLQLFPLGVAPGGPTREAFTELRSWFSSANWLELLLIAFGRGAKEPKFDRKDGDSG